MTNDPIADTLTRIRNGLVRRKGTIDVPASNLIRGVLKVLRAEGYINGFDEIEDGKQGTIRIHLKYGPDGEVVLSNMERVSKSSRRVYKKAEEIEPVLGGLGVAVYSTSKGVLSDRQARHNHVGGEWLCTIW